MTSSETEETQIYAQIVMQQVRIRVNRDYMTRYLCNISKFNANTVTPHSLGEISTEFMFFHKLGFKSENELSSIRSHLGRL